MENKKIIEAANLPEKDKVYLKKDIFGWRVVHPIRNEDGTLNWSNLLFGGKRNLVFLIALLLIASFVLYAYSHDIKVIESHYQEIVDDPIGYCKGLYGESIADRQWADEIPEIDINFGGDING